MVMNGKSTLPALLSFNGGYVDTAGFLALQGLFTAHVTGNFVTIAAALAFGSSGVITKLLALPVFCVVIIVVRLAFIRALTAPAAALSRALTLKLVLLVVAAALAVHFGPFANADAWPGMLTGLTLVAAMAIQNAVHRIHLSSAPPSTLMTGTTTQLMIDIADSLGGLPPEKRAVTRARMRAMVVAMTSFAAGAALAAVLFNAFHTWCFVVAPGVALLARLAARHGPLAQAAT